MAKVQGSYSSITRGVSQQSPADRLVGQHGEQVNMLADPVRGLVRRNGFELRGTQFDLDPGSTEFAAASARPFRCHTHRAEGGEYDILYASRQTSATTVPPPDSVLCYNRLTEAWMPTITSPTFGSLVVNGVSAITSVGKYLLLAGAGATPEVTSAGKWDTLPDYTNASFWVRGGGFSRTYTVSARTSADNITLSVSYTTLAAAFPGTLDTSSVLLLTPNVASAESLTTSSATYTTGSILTLTTSLPVAGRFGAGGTYNIAIGGRFRIYQEIIGIGTNFNTEVDLELIAFSGSSITVRVVAVRISKEPVLPPGNVMITGSLFQHIDNTEYSAQVNAITDAYNTAVNKWTADSNASIVPGNIAQELVNRLNAQIVATGSLAPMFTRQGSQGFNTGINALTVSSDGPQDQIQAAQSTVASVGDLTPLHFPGKVIRVQPRADGVGEFYMRAVVASDLAPVPGAPVQVRWVEGSGETRLINQLFGIGLIFDNRLFLADSPFELQGLLIAEGFPAEAAATPNFAPSTVGDADSVPVPGALTQPITGMAVFQDRLMLMSGSNITLSKTGDYFNFWRSTVLALPDDDPIDVTSIGNEDDVLRKAVLYDRNLLVFGDRSVYNVSGRSNQTPSTFTIAVQLNVDNTADAQPVGAGQHVMFLKNDPALKSTRPLQVRAGLFQDSPVVTDVGLQLVNYINGTPAEIVSLVSPDVTFVRTEPVALPPDSWPPARPWGLYVYQYLDQPTGERITDSWSAWEWDSALGWPLGMSATSSGDGIRLYTLAYGKDVNGMETRGLMAYVCSARTEPTGLPYLDGMKLPPYDAETTGLWTPGADAHVRNKVFTASRELTGNSLPSRQDIDTRPEHPHYTVGTTPPERVDGGRWYGFEGWVTNFLLNMPAGSYSPVTGLEYPAYVDITCPFVRSREGKANTLGRLTLTKLRITTARTVGLTAQFIDFEGKRTTLSYGQTYNRYRYDNNIWVGRNVHDVQIRLGAELWYPLTISSIEWQGQWFTNSRRVS